MRYSLAPLLKAGEEEADVGAIDAAGAIDVGGIEALLKVIEECANVGTGDAAILIEIGDAGSRDIDKPRGKQEIAGRKKRTAAGDGSAGHDKGSDTLGVDAGDEVGGEREGDAKLNGGAGEGLVDEGGGDGAGGIVDERRGAKYATTQATDDRFERNRVWIEQA